MTKPEPRESSYTSNGNGNKSWWYVILRDFGTPTAAAVALGFVVWNFLLVPSRDHTEKLIQANVSSQESLIRTTDKMATAIEGINESLESLDHSVGNSEAFMKVVSDTHAEQLVAIRENGTCSKENTTTAKEILETMKRAETSMADVPAERQKQTKLLEEIRDKIKVVQ